MTDIQIKNLSKWYGQVLGISNITVHIGPGVTGLLGPNGAGKSTLLKILTGQLKADTGGATIGGIPVWNRTELYEIVGFCPDMEKFYERLTGWEFLTYMARLQGMSKSKAQDRARETMHLMGLDDAIHKRIGAYSKGMRQRVKFGQAILHEPQVIFLDEPMQGMDPLGRLQTAEMIREFSRQGKSILVSSHILNEVEEMTNRILVLNHGQLLAEGDVHEIRELIEEQPRHVRILSSERRKLSNILVGCPEVQTITFGDEPGELMVQTLSPDAFYQRLPGLVIDEGIPIDQIATLDDNLESVFEYLVK